MKKSVVVWRFAGLVLLPVMLEANVKPEVVIHSAAVRPETTLVDITFCVNDPDDDTVKVRALAFIDGDRSFAKAIRLQTLVEGTELLLGDKVAANVNHKLTWDAGADCEVNVRRLRVEVMALDERGLLSFEWVTIPATEESEEVTISRDEPDKGELLDALFWMYADNDPWLELKSGVLKGNAASGAFHGISLAEDREIRNYAAPFLFKKMNLALSKKVRWAMDEARAVPSGHNKWFAEKRPYDGLSLVVGLGGNAQGQLTAPDGLTDVIAIAAGGEFSLALNGDGTVAGWGSRGFGQVSIPDGLTDVKEIAAGGGHSLALKNDGTIIAWGYDAYGQCRLSKSLTDVVAIAAGRHHSLALFNDGTVTAWGANGGGQSDVPEDLSDVTAIAAGLDHNLALKADGTVVAWGGNEYWEQTDVPEDLTGVIAIAAGLYHSVALKQDGTVVAWGRNEFGQIDVPAGLRGVTAISAGPKFTLAVQDDGTVIGWGENTYNPLTIPAWLPKAKAISAGYVHSLILTEELE